jgi:hypothetical protein
VFLFSSNLSNSSVVCQYVCMYLLIISVIIKPVTTLHIVVVYNHNFSMFIVYIFPSGIHSCTSAMYFVVYFNIAHYLLIITCKINLNCEQAPVVSIDTQKSSSFS